MNRPLQIHFDNIISNNLDKFPTKLLSRMMLQIPRKELYRGRSILNESRVTQDILWATIRDFCRNRLGNEIG
jgi:hypothetical protein